MERRSLVKVVVLAVVGGVGLGIGAGCQWGPERVQNNPYVSEQGKLGEIGDTPQEVQDFVKASYPDATVEKVYEKRHKENYTMRHFAIHLVMEGGRKKTVDYNVFMKPALNPKELRASEVEGAGTSAEAQLPKSMRSNQ